MKNLITIILLFFISISAHPKEIDTEFFKIDLPDELNIQWNKSGIILGSKKNATTGTPFLIIYYSHVNDKKYNSVGKNTEYLINKTLTQAKFTTYKKFGLDAPNKIKRKDGIIEYRKSFAITIEGTVVNFIHIVLGVKKGVVDLRYLSANSTVSTINYAENILKTIQWK